MQMSSYCIAMALELLCLLTCVTPWILLNQLQKALVIHCTRLSRSLLVSQVKDAVFELAGPNFHLHRRQLLCFLIS